MINHWDNFYSSFINIIEPSSFTSWCEKYLYNKKDYTLFDIGCGNGRDSKFWVDNGWKVIAVDNCFNAYLVTKNHLMTCNSKKWNVCCTNATDDIYCNSSIIYSRFWLHAVDQETQNNWLSTFLKYNDIFLTIEARTTDQNKHIETYDGHYRRLLCPTLLVDELESYNFKICQKLIGSGLSVYNNDNPELIRILAYK